MTATIARELTDWYPAEVKPVHVGYYHTPVDQSSPALSMYNWWWNGEIWLYDEGGPICHWQDRPWRGLRSPA